jgi:hypothetical protein
MTFQQVAPRARPEPAQHLNIACIGRQDHDAGIREFPADGTSRVDAIRARHPQVHQRDIRTAPAKLVGGLTSVCGLRHQLHVRFICHQRGNSLAKHGVVVAVRT